MNHFEEMCAPYQEALNLLEKHEIPESCPEDRKHCLFWGGCSLDEGSMLVRDKVIALAGYAFLVYSWLRPLAK